MTHWLRRATTGAGLTLLLAVGLTACGGSAPAPTNPPATTVSAPTTAATEPATSSEAASPAAAVATPMAAGAAEPTKEPNPERAVSRDCEGYVAWMNDPTVKADLEKVALWPEVVAAAEQAASGATVDAKKMEDAGLAMEKIAPRLRTSDESYDVNEMGHLAAKAMGLAKHMADTLAKSDIDKNAVATDLAELKTAINAYQQEASARAAECS